jgi:DNA-binding transcriptional regulator YiaG
MNEELKEFSEFVKNMRTAAGLTAEEFASLLNCSKTSIFRYENGINCPKDYAGFVGRVREITKTAIREKREAAV